MVQQHSSRSAFEMGIFLIKQRMTKHARLHLATGLVALLAGCASIDFDYPRAGSKAVVDTEDTTLGSQVTQLSASRLPGSSGFYPLPDGIDALTA